MILITGGAGFIGTNFILNWFERHTEGIVNLDKLTYAANQHHLELLQTEFQYIFVQGDISDRALVRDLLEKHSIRAVIHLAAESHVDRSIDDPSVFIETNVMGTFHLLESVRTFYLGLPEKQKIDFRFLHVSTDEVYGTLEEQESPFSEDRAYSPNNPYSASKAASDHLVHAWFRTYGLPVLTTHCSNNYGPFQFSEKLTPLIILNALNNKSIPIYGDGKQIRDWLHVKDHCQALEMILEKGNIGEVYNIGGQNEHTNLEITQTICSLLDKLKPRCDGESYQQQIIFIEDRQGHDFRYAINTSKVVEQIGWENKVFFLDGLYKTVEWYLKYFNEIQINNCSTT